jgi:hypothetical protein
MMEQLKNEDMTEEDYFALDDLLTKTTPKLGPNGHGFFADRGINIITVDTAKARLINARALSVHKTPQEIVSQMAKRELIEAM